MRVAAIGCVLIAVIVIALTQWIDDPSTHAIYGARFWPTFLAVSLLALNLPVALLPKTESRGAGAAVEPAPLEDLAAISKCSFLVPSLLVVLYPLAVDFIGFPLASIILYILLMLALGQRGFILTQVIGLVFPLALAYFFTRIAYMPLPKGAGPFEDFTILLYRAIGAY